MSPFQFGKFSFVVWMILRKPLKEYLDPRHQYRQNAPCCTYKEHDIQRPKCQGNQPIQHDHRMLIHFDGRGLAAWSFAMPLRSLCDSKRGLPLFNSQRPLASLRKLDNETLEMGHFCL